MNLSLDLALFGTAFATVLVIMDPLGNVPVFLAVTRDHDLRSRRRAAGQASLVAGGIIAVFAAFGERVLRALGISLPALQVAGGLLLLLIALELLRPGGSAHAAPPTTDADGDGDGDLAGNVAFVPLGTPLLAGPGAIATTILFMREAGSPGQVISVVLALAAVLLVIWLALRFSAELARLLRTNGIDLLSRVMGLLVAAIAAQLVAVAVQDWIRHGVH